MFGFKIVDTKKEPFWSRSKMREQNIDVDGGLRIINQDKYIEMCMEKAKQTGLNRMMKMSLDDLNDNQLGVEE